MRMIEMVQKMWDCPRCGRSATLAIKKCRGCGYVYLSDEIAAQEKKEKRRKKSGGSQSVDGSFIKSTLPSDYHENNEGKQ